MNHRVCARRLMLAVGGGLLLQAGLAAGPQIQYPATRTGDHVDTYFGTAVPDPYRWLEDDNAPETATWVEAQNAVTFGYLGRIPYRAALKTRLERLYDYPRYSSPRRKGSRFFFSKNDGLQNQSVLYVQEGLDGKPEVLLDPNTWSADGTVRLGTFSLSKDGRHAVLRHFAQRVRLAAVQGHRNRHEADAARYARLGEGVRRVVAR